MKTKKKKDFKILIVDDEESIVNFLKATMEDEGFSVLHSTNAEQAVEICKVNQPDLVMLDLRMPSLDGIEVLKRIRERDKEHAVLVVLISAYGAEMSEADKTLMDKLAVSDFIPKGVSLFEAKERIYKVIQSKYKIS